MNAILAAPLPVRLLLIAAAGWAAGWLAHRFAQRLIHAPGSQAIQRRLGRSLFVPLATGLALAGLYWWEIDQLRLVRGLAQPGFRPALDDLTHLHAAFLSHAVLVFWMLVASLVDLDEQTIPDEITVPGTLCGLLLAMASPASLLPIVTRDANGVQFVEFLTVNSPHPWPARLAPFPHLASLAIALACYVAWCLALLPRSWHGRHGWRRGFALLAARVMREPSSRWVLAVGVLGCTGIGGVWFIGGEHWHALASALVGLVAGAAMIWSVRVVGHWALGREAMGFGDVTLMAMIGSYLGWQAMPIVFFLAPLVGVALGLVQWFMYRDNVLPYGPFLCLGALVVIVQWAPIWTWAEPLYAVTWLVPGVMVLCMGMLAALLAAWKKIARLIVGHS